MELWGRQGYMSEWAGLVRQTCRIPGPLSHLANIREWLLWARQTRAQGTQDKPQLQETTAQICGV